jgi:phosphoribosylformylglycinamidine synthase
VRQLILASRVDAVHDLSDGGLAVALAEMAMASGIGAKLIMALGASPHGVLFGEDQARYLMTASSEEASRIVADAIIAGVPAALVGVTGGDSVDLPGEAPVAIEKLASAHEDWLPAFMAGPAA